MKAAKFLSAERMAEAVAQIAELAKEAGERVILIGGAAMQLYGSDRLTLDVDFAADNHLPSLVRHGKLLFGGEQTVAPNGVSVDFVVRSDEFRSLYREAVKMAQTIEGVPMPVVRPEHLVAMKMVAGRDKDLTDLTHLLGVAGLVDVVKTRAIVHQHLGAYAAKDFDGHVEEAEWKKARNARS